MLGVFLTQHNNKNAFSMEVEGTLEMVAADFKMPVLPSVRKSMALREAAALQQSVLEYAPTCYAVQDYDRLVDELFLGRLGADDKK